VEAERTDCGRLDALPDHAWRDRTIESDSPAGYRLFPVSRTQLPPLADVHALSIGEVDVFVPQGERERAANP